MKYHCIRDCYFNNNFYKKGKFYDFPGSVEVPHHFNAVKAVEPGKVGEIDPDEKKPGRSKVPDEGKKPAE